MWSFFEESEVSGGIMSLTTVDRSEKSGELILKGELAIQRISEVKEELKRALDEVDNLMVNLSEGSDFDLSCLQLLCSAQRTAVCLNKSLQLAGRPPEGLKKALRETGFLKHLGCDLSCEEKCIWNI